MQGRLEKTAEELLDLTERNLDLAECETDPCKWQALSQAGDASMRAYANATKSDLVLAEREQIGHINDDSWFSPALSSPCDLHHSIEPLQVITDQETLTAKVGAGASEPYGTRMTA